MIRALLLLLALLAPHPAWAQDDTAPRLTMDVDKTETVPGQAVSIRLTVLVPTFMPNPPIWPSFEAPNLLVRVASTGPTSQRIGGETWAGISRRYLVTPMVPGRVTLRSAAVTVTYADPETNAPVKATLPAEPITLTGTIPPGAEGLDPFLAADAVSLKETVEGTPDAMVPGDSVTRTVVASIRGTSPMFLPTLLPPTPIDGVRLYPDEPVLEEKNERGAITGTRTERVTMVAEGGGSGAAAPVALDWFNLRTGKVETARAEGFAVKVDGPPAASTLPAEPVDWRAVALAAILGLALVGALVALVRRVGPPLLAAIRVRRAARLASEAHAFSVLMRTIAAHDHPALRPALDTWAARAHGPDPREDPGLAAALAALGAARYGTRTGDDADAWQKIRAALQDVRQRQADHRITTALPPLNPAV
ncbi:BatD family protein [Acuticoccus kandeliae]|uniref:BatD family protein n=1 Tax=Acuticoccus kandeliae TaxID=2073160 RepID=UPI000D3EDCF4|nr:BatD family protein [Acuticoccus kandeliae]